MMDISLELEEALSKLKGEEGVELEMRTSVSYATFERVLSFLSKEHTPVQQEIVDYIFDDGSRKSIFLQEGKNIREEAIIKKRIHSKKLQNYDLKLSLAQEIKIDEETLLEKEVVLIREKERTSFKIKECSLDLTRVESISPTSGNSTLSFEIEIESDNATAVNVPSFVELTTSLYGLIKDSLLISLTAEKEVETALLQKLGEDPKSNFYSKARNIKLEDFLNTSLFYNSYGLRVSHKLDGERRLLFLSKNLPNETPGGGFLLNFSKGGCSVQYKIENYQGEEAIIDGEYLNGKFYYFDCLYFGGERRHLPLTERLRPVDALFSKYTPVGLEVVSIGGEIIYGPSPPKEFVSSSAQHFYDVVAHSLTTLKQRKEKTDGLMFCPISSDYYALTSTKTKSSLFSHPNIVKYKPKEKITIDFEFGGDKLYSFYKKDKVVFSAKNFSPSVNVDWDSILSAGVKEGDIIELSPLFKEVPILTFERMRKDKLRPNAIAVAVDIWEDIVSPLSEDVITGKSLEIMKNYSRNKIKDILSEEKRAFISLGWEECTPITEKKSLVFISKDSPHVNSNNPKVKVIPLAEEEITLTLKKNLQSMSRLGDPIVVVFPLVWNSLSPIRGVTSKKLIRILKELATACGPRTEILFKFTGCSNIEEVSSLVEEYDFPQINLSEILSKSKFTLEEYLPFEYPFFSDFEKKISSYFGVGAWKSTPYSMYLAPGEIEGILIEDDKFNLNGVTRDLPLSKALSFFLPSQIIVDENKSLEEISEETNLEIFVVKNNEIYQYTPTKIKESKAPIILYALPEGVYYPVTQF